MSKIPRNLGRIRVNTGMVYEKPDDLLPMFLDFVPVHIESRPHMDDFVYTGYSTHFSDVEYGHDLPFYDVVISKGNDGTITVKYEKV